MFQEKPTNAPCRGSAEPKRERRFVQRFPKSERWDCYETSGIHGLRHGAGDALSRRRGGHGAVPRSGAAAARRGRGRAGGLRHHGRSADSARRGAPGADRRDGRSRGAPRPGHRGHRLQRHRPRRRADAGGGGAGRGRGAGGDALLQQGDRSRAGRALHRRRRRGTYPGDPLQRALPHGGELLRRGLRRPRRAPEHRRRQGGKRQFRPHTGHAPPLPRRFPPLVGQRRGHRRHHGAGRRGRDLHGGEPHPRRDAGADPSCHVGQSPQGSAWRSCCARCSAR